jgi:hypothetical protein
VFLEPGWLKDLCTWPQPVTDTRPSIVGLGTRRPLTDLEFREGCLLGSDDADHLDDGLHPGSVGTRLG